MLDVRIFGMDRQTPPELLVVLCHGYGAGGDDLVPIGPELVRIAPQLAGRVAFAFPAAPLELAMGFGDARAWWPIDFPRLEGAVRAGDLTALYDDVPAGMAEARAALEQTLAAVAAETGVPRRRMVLGGFSQGSMLTTDVALGAGADDAPAGLIAWSGLLLNRAAWTRAAPARKGMPVFQSHGTRDPLLPYAAALELQKLFVDAGLDHTFVGHGGAHEIPRAVLDGTAQWLAQLLGRLS